MGRGDGGVRMGGAGVKDEAVGSVTVRIGGGGEQGMRGRGDRGGEY